MTTPTLSRLPTHRRLRVANVFVKSVADRTVLVLVAGLGLAAMGLLVGPMYPGLEDTLAQMAADLPETVTAMIGGADMSTPSGWINTELYSMMVPGVIVYVAAASVTRAFAGEAEDKSLDLLAANPVSRGRLALDKAGATAVHVAAVVALSALGVWVGVAIPPLDVGIGGIWAISLHVALLGTTFGALGMLLAVLTSRRLVSLLLTAAAALIAYAWASYAPQSEALTGYAELSPWYLYNGTDPLANGPDWTAVLVLAGLTLALGGAALVVFRRRDLPG